MPQRHPRSVRRWLVFIALLHWLIFVILLLQGLSRHARYRSAPTVSSPYAERPAPAGTPERERP